MTLGSQAGRKLTQVYLCTAYGRPVALDEVKNTHAVSETAVVEPGFSIA